MLIGDMTAVKYELNYNCLSQSIMRSGLQDVVPRTVAKCEQQTDFIYYSMLHRGKDPQGQKSVTHDKFSSLSDIYVIQL